MRAQGMRKMVRTTVLASALLLVLTGMPALAQDDQAPPGAVGYDLETGEWLFDADGDSFPDLTEELGGTDPSDPESNPLALIEAARKPPHGDPTGNSAVEVGFTRRACRPGYIEVPGAPNLCITLWMLNSANYTQAFTNCRAQQARVCSYEDYGYLFLSTPYDATFNTAGLWLGDFTNDDNVNCGNFTVTFNNDPNIWNFEGTCSKWDRRPYRCCHDRDNQHP